MKAMDQIINKADYSQSCCIDTFEDENVKVPIVFADELFSDEGGLDFTGKIAVLMQHPGRGTVCFTLTYENDKWIQVEEVSVGDAVIKWCSVQIDAKKSC
jgi:hypothetical protein